MATATLEVHEEKKKQSTHDFWLLYLSGEDENVFADAVHALYYLPESYKLIVICSSPSEHMMSIIAQNKLEQRVRFVSEAGLSSKTSPFFVADAVLYDSAMLTVPGAMMQPAVVSMKNAPEHIAKNEWGGFTIQAGLPEAIASAALRIARTSA